MFLVEGLKHLGEVGTIFPSSPWLARALTRATRRRGSPKRVLEVGAGTGAVTRAILRTLDDGDELHLVEINPGFCRMIEHRLIRPFCARKPGVRVFLHCGSITSVPLSGRFDAIVCTLPFLAFPAREVRAILKRLADLVAEGGELTYMQYAGARMLQAPFVSRSRRRNLDRIGAVCRSVDRRYDGSRELVVLNLMPSVVSRLTRDERAASRQGPRGARRPAVGRPRRRSGRRLGGVR